MKLCTYFVTIDAKAYGHGPWTFEKLFVFRLESSTCGVFEKLQIIICSSQNIFRTTLSSGRYKKPSFFSMPYRLNNVYTSIGLFLFYHCGNTMPGDCASLQLCTSNQQDSPLRIGHFVLIECHANCLN